MHETHPAYFTRSLLAMLAVLVAPACSQTTGRMLAANRVLDAPSPWPAPQALPPDAAPHILAVWMNETTIRPGRRWMGRIVTSTNVASVEVRTESFSFAADHRRFGDFVFSQDVLDIIPQYRRAYTLHIIARNTRGDTDERVVPILIR
ncbi:MAG TPA: hypothetical protein VGG51_04315 [Candidatus Cybelea sp.]